MRRRVLAAYDRFWLGKSLCRPRRMALKLSRTLCCLTTYRRMNHVDESEHECCVCLDMFRKDDVRTLVPCQHLLCEQCTRKHIQRRIDKCPLCRETFNLEQHSSELQETIPRPIDETPPVNRLQIRFIGFQAPALSNGWRGPMLHLPSNVTLVRRHELSPPNITLENYGRLREEPHEDHVQAAIHMQGLLPSNTIAGVADLTTLSITEVPMSNIVVYLLENPNSRIANPERYRQFFGV